MLFYTELANEVQQIMEKEFWKGRLTDDIIIIDRSDYFPFEKLKISNQKTIVRELTSMAGNQIEGENL